MDGKLFKTQHTQWHQHIYRTFILCLYEVLTKKVCNALVYTHTNTYTYCTSALVQQTIYLITAILGASASQKKRRKILEVQPQWKSIFANWQKHFPYISNPVSISTFYVTAFLKLDWINRLSSCKHSFLQRNNVKLQTETYLFSKLGQPRGQNPVCE